jgi:ATP-dependent protease ClpP protease subunit
MCIHNPSPYRHSVKLNVLENAGPRADLIDRLRKIQECFINIYMKRATKTRKEIGLKLEEEKPMSATEALDYGLIDEII